MIVVLSFTLCPSSRQMKQLGEPSLCMGEPDLTSSGEVYRLTAGTTDLLQSYQPSLGNIAFRNYDLKKVTAG